MRYLIIPFTILYMCYSIYAKKTTTLITLLFCSFLFCLPTVLQAHAVPKAPTSKVKKLAWLPKFLQPKSGKKQSSHFTKFQAKNYKEASSKQATKDISSELILIFIVISILPLLSFLFAWIAVLFWVAGWVWLIAALVAGILLSIATPMMIESMGGIYGPLPFGAFWFISLILFTLAGIIGLIYGLSIISIFWVLGSLAFLLPMLAIIILVIVISIK